MALPALVFPLLSAVLMVVMVLTTYIIAVGLDHVSPVWPYISDLGVLYPESCITAFLSGMVAATGFPAAFIRHKYIVSSKAAESNPSLNKVATFGLVCLCIAFTGLVINACFQRFQVDQLHTVGGAILFVFGFFASACDTFLTIRINDGTASNAIRNLRILCTVLLPICGIISFICKRISENQANEAFPKMSQAEMNYRILHWDYTLAGFDLHLVSTLTELVVIFVFFAHVCSLTYEFKNFKADLLLIPSE